MVLEHLVVVHLIDVVTREDEHIIGVISVNEGEILIDRVSSSLVPVC